MPGPAVSAPCQQLHPAPSPACRDSASPGATGDLDPWDSSSWCLSSNLRAGDRAVIQTKAMTSCCP
ncbi:hypothetical protein P7K49_029606, partial [Saguinus oedipus]